MKITLGDIKKVDDSLPDEGVLCFVFLPIGEHVQDGRIYGASTTAYYRRAEGWVHADTPNALQFKPYYWVPVEIVRCYGLAN